MDLLRANLHARKTEDHYNARLFWGGGGGETAGHK